MLPRSCLVDIHSLSVYSSAFRHSSDGQGCLVPIAHFNGVFRLYADVIVNDLFVHFTCVHLNPVSGLHYIYGRRSIDRFFGQ